MGGYFCSGISLVLGKRALSGLISLLAGIRPNNMRSHGVPLFFILTTYFYKSGIAGNNFGDLPKT